MGPILRTLALAAIALAVVLVGTAGPAPGQPVTDILLAAEPGESWLHTNGNWAGHRYSTLTQLNPSNVKSLKLAWLYSTGGKTDAQNTPLYHDGLVYFAQDNIVYALDARSGRRAWKYEHKLPEDWGGYNVPFITGKHRGLAIYGEHIYFLSNDAKLHAIHYKTGQVKFVKAYPDFPYPKDFAKSQDANGYATTVGPTAIPGQIILPMNGTDFGGLPGYVIGVDPNTGDMKWKANMIPGPNEEGYDTWPPGSHEWGGAGPWITGAWDPELKMYYTGTANAYPWNPKTRGGGGMDNLGAAGVVAVNTETGKTVWRYTAVPGDPWDYDTPQTPMVVSIDGRKTVVHPNKTGYIHYLAPETGKFLRAVPFADKITWIKGYDANGRPVGQIDLPIEGGPKVEMWPSLTGGVNMFPAAYNPQTGYVYLPAVNTGMKYFYEDIKILSNVRHFGANWEFIWGYEVNLAKDVKTGAEAWRDQKSKHGYAGGMLTTAGNLVFYTSQNGAFQATNATTGEILYTFNLGTTAYAGPITFMVDGKQCVVQPVGGTPAKFGYQEHNMEHGGLVAAFCL
jgi:PQQ-dependent dehydrogenase (methanol/ethanol family)